MLVRLVGLFLVGMSFMYVVLMLLSLVGVVVPHF